jgi:hypothetical protein
MKIPVVILFLLFCGLRHSREPIKTINGNFFGTLITSFIGKNGIVVSADSRTVLYNSKGKVLAYFEETSKIFQVKNFLIAVAGQYTFDNTSIENLIQEISASGSLANSDLYSLHDSFLCYAKKRLPDMEYFRLHNNQYIISGYYHDTPTILFYDGYKELEIVNEGYITNSSRYNDNRRLKRNIRSLTVDTLIPISVKFVEGLEEARNKEDNWSIIGGPVSTAIITDDKVTWIKDQNRNNFRNFRDFHTSYNSGRIKIFFRSPQDSIDFSKRFSR